MANLTITQCTRLAQELNQVVDSQSVLVDEEITVEVEGTFIYIFCKTELGMYRVVNHYRKMFDRLNYGYAYYNKLWCVSFENQMC